MKEHVVKTFHSEINGYRCTCNVIDKEVPANKIIGTVDDKGRIITPEMINGHSTVTLRTTKITKMERIDK